MSDEIKALVERLRIAAEMKPNKIERAACIEEEAAHFLTAQADEIERLNGIVKRVQGAAKTIMHAEGEELARLRKQAQEHHLAIRTLDSEREANALLTDEIERLRAALIEEREDNLWEAYNSGNVKDGQWTHMFMSDGEWLARECGLDPSQGHYDDAEIRAAIPRAALKAAQEVKS